MEACMNHAYEFEEMYLQHKDDMIALPDKLDMKKLKISLDALTEYFCDKYGDIGIPLSYVIQENVAPPTANLAIDDYTVDDLILRAHQSGRYWPVDNASVWSVMNHVFQGTTRWQLISPFQHRRDGREAYHAFVTHFLGTGNRNALFTAAIRWLNMVSYDGEKQNYGVNEYLAVLLEYFNDIRLYGRPEDQLTGPQQVRYLTKSVQCTLAKAAAAISTIQANDAMQDDFTLASNHLWVMIGQIKTTPWHLQMSQLDHNDEQE